jgi:outer membrane immunogenic protein
MFKRWFGAAALAAACACSAHAADMPLKAVAPAAISSVNWTGWFGGVSIGYASGDVEPFLGAGGPIRLSPSGFEAALHGGFDYQAMNSNLVFGIEVTVPLIQLNDSKPDPVVAGESYSAKSRWAVMTTGKVGYAVGRWLPYVGAGVGFINSRGGSVIPGVVTQDDTHTHAGWLLIAGLRYMVNPNWWVGVQYSHGEYSRETYVTVPAFPIANRSVDFSTDAVLFQASYRFTRW